MHKSKERIVSLAMVAYVYLGLEDIEKALKLWNQAFEGQGGRLIYLQVDPWLDTLRDVPDFQDLVRRMKFPQP